MCKQIDDWKIWNYNLSGAFNPGEQNAHLPNHWNYKHVSKVNVIPIFVNRLSGESTLKVCDPILLHFRFIPHLGCNRRHQDESTFLDDRKSWVLNLLLTGG